jgi:hypothetical protein
MSTPASPFFCFASSQTHLTATEKGGSKKFSLDLYGVNATFKNSSVISWLSVLLVEETEVPREKN